MRLMDITENMKLLRLQMSKTYIWLKMIKEKSETISKYPTVIQLPITYHCNFDCVMCGMHKMMGKKDFTPDQLSKILEDKLYKNVKIVGINGGEPFIKPNLVEYVRVLIDRLDKLESIDIISNGFLTDNILNSLKTIKALCKERKIKVNISFSLDGIEDMQDFHRGCLGSYKKIENTIKEITKNRELYADYANVICTITRYNIYRINEVEAWGLNRKIDVSYNVATMNRRIENFDKVNNFSIFSDEQARMLTQEFFYKKYLTTNSKRYFALYLFVKTGERYSDCPCKTNKWVTLTPDCQLGYCATHSKNLGSAVEHSSYDLFNGNLSYLNELKNQYCKTCSHYIYGLNSDGLKKLYEERLKNEFFE